MYFYTSNAFNEAIMKEGRTFRARLTCGEEIIDSGFKSIKIFGGSNNADTITIGSTISQRIEVEMSETEVSISGKEWFLEIGLLIEDKIEYIPMGYFTPEKPLTNNGTTTFKAYDRMMKLSGTYYCTLAEINTITILEDIAEKTGVPINSAGYQKIPMTKPVGYTYREVLMYVAQLLGKFANVNRYGAIDLNWWTEVEGYEITPDNTNGFEHDENEYVLGYVFMLSKDSAGENVSLSAGDGDRGISIQNPFATEDVVESVYSKVGGFTYTVSSVNCPLGDIRLDPWDVVQVMDINGKSYKVPLMSLEFEYDGGVSVKFSCVGNTKTEEEYDYKGPMQMLQEKMEAKVEGLRGVVSVIQQTAGQVYVENSDEMGTFSSIFNTEVWETKYVDANGEELSGLYFDPLEKQLVFNGTITAGSININGKFVVDSEGNAKLYSAKFFSEDNEIGMELDSNGLNMYDGQTFIPMARIGYEDYGGTKFPFLMFWANGDNNIDKITIVQQFYDGTWIGNLGINLSGTGGYFKTNEYTNGLFIDHDNGEVYCVKGNDKRIIYTGEAIAKFG